MIEIADIIKNYKKPTPVGGGEKNFIINQFIEPLNNARKRQNAQNYRLARKTNKYLSRAEYTRTKAYLTPLGHGRIVRELKRAFGKWENISTSQLYELLSICKQSDNFSWTFWTRLKKAREQRNEKNKTNK